MCVCVCVCVACCDLSPPSHLGRIVLIPEQVPGPDSVEEKGAKKKGAVAAVESPPPVDENVDINEAVRVYLHVNYPLSKH